MKTLSLCIALALALFSFEAQATIAQVAQTSQAAGSSSGVTTSGINTTGSTLIVVAVAYASSPGVFTLTDSVGGNNNTSCFQSIATYTNNLGGNSITLFYCNGPANVGVGHTFTISGTGTYPAIAVMAFSGTATSSSLDQHNGVGGSASGTTWQPGSITPGQNNEVLITAINMYNTSASAPTINSSYNSPVSANFSAGTSFGIGMSYLVQTTAVASNPTWTTPSGNISALIASFKIPVVGSPQSALMSIQ